MHIYIDTDVLQAAHITNLCLMTKVAYVSTAMSPCTFFMGPIFARFTLYPNSPWFGRTEVFATEHTFCLIRIILIIFLLVFIGGRLSEDAIIFSDDSKSQLISVEQSLLGSQISALVDLIALYKALGGGWERSDANQTHTSQ